MKTVEISAKTEQVLKLIAADTPINFLERIEIAILVEELRNTAAEEGVPVYRSKYNDAMKTDTKSR